MSELRIGKQAIGNLPAGGHTTPAGQVGMDYAKIVNTDMRELRAACDLADRPHAGRGVAAVALWEKQHGRFTTEEMDEARRSVRAQLRTSRTVRRSA